MLILGGVVFDEARGLVGHSDADVIAHACADALLGAAGLGDIGQHFPDTDPAWSGADSIRMLAHVVELLAAAGWRPSNIDCAVVCEEPKLAPRHAEMQQRLSEVVGAPVSIKGNWAEQLGAIGRREGIVGFATALIVRPPAGATDDDDCDGGEERVMSKRNVGRDGSGRGSPGRGGPGRDGGDAGAVGSWRVGKWRFGS